jgi:ABC-type nickel/cobalt efflux system permease component RcnA
MSATSEAVPGAATESASIATLVADWMSATGSRIRITTELAFAEARLAATSLTLMVLMGMLSALFIFGAWGLVVAGLVAAALQYGISLWLTLAALSLLHALGAWLLWRGATGLSRYLEFAATRQQMKKVQEVDHDMGEATTAR